MTSPGPAPALDPRKALLRSNGAAALTWSIALHAALVYAVSRLPWIVVESGNRPQTAVVWLSDWRPVEDERQAEPERATEPPELLVDSPSPSEIPVPEQAPNDTLQEEPAPAQATAPPGADAPLPDNERAEAEVERDQAESVSPVTTLDPSAPNDVVRGVDWEAERRRAIEQLREQRERDETYLTFSVDDLIEQAPSEEPLEPQPEKSVFESSPGSGRAALPYGRSRGKLGRLASEMCHALTGGFSLFGVMSVCAEDNARSDLFAHIKPDYLKKRPVCEEVPIMRAQLVDPGSASETATAVKCRLVAEDE